MKLDNIHSVYFVGIGGIGMSALARWFMHYGKTVAGYDRTPTVLTAKLEAEGAAIHYEDNISLINEEILNNPLHSLIIYTPAIPVGHSELDFFRNEGFEVFKRSEVLGLISQNMFTIAIAGTHGKTTTSSMIAHMLHQGGVSFTGLIGGIMTNYDSNLIISGNSPDVFVVEADEYDRSFLRLSPNIAVITSMDADHLDIYGQTNELVNSFKEFAEKLPEDGLLYYHHDLTDSVQNFNVSRTFSYGHVTSDIMNRVLEVKNGLTHFEVGLEANAFTLELALPGKYNVDNATVAASVAAENKVSIKDLKAGTKSYQGVKRRFEYVLKTPHQVFIDDYAHHPTEISAFIEGVRSIYPNKKMLVVFQPHLYSRTRDFIDGFAKSLSLADEVVLLDIYPAREMPIPGVTSKLIYDKLEITHKTLCTKEDLISILEGKEIELLCTVGAGDIDQLVEPIRKLLNRQMA